MVSIAGSRERQTPILGSLSSVYSGTPVQGMVPPTVKIGLPFWLNISSDILKGAFLGDATLCQADS